MKSDIKYNIEQIYKQIDKAVASSGRAAGSVKLLGVTKQVGLVKIITALESGLMSFGENYVQEFINKYESIPINYYNSVDWHFIGHLQRNKVKYIIDKVNLIHSVSKLTLAQEIDKRASNIGKNVSVLIEVNLAGEDSKSGISIDKIEYLLDDINKLNNIDVLGLMSIPPFFDNPEKVRPYFVKLRELRDKLTISYNALKELSMGMSGDYEVAIEEGATIVRIGTAIFGERKK